MSTTVHLAQVQVESYSDTRCRIYNLTFSANTNRASLLLRSQYTLISVSESALQLGMRLSFNFVNV